MSEPAQARGTAATPLVPVQDDLVEVEARLLALEQRLREQDVRDQLLLAIAEGLRGLTEAVGPVLDAVAPTMAPGGEPSDTALTPPAALSHVRPQSPPSGPQITLEPGSPSSGPRTTVEPERLALAQARIREAAADAPPPPDAPASAAVPGRRSWLLPALRWMVQRDPDAAGRLLVALLPAHRLAGIDPVPQLPGRSATVARVVVRGRLRRRIGWEMAQLACELTTVSALAKLVRLRASPVQLRAAGVRVDSRVALDLVAGAIDPLWTLGHRFTIAHLDAGASYLHIRAGRRPSVSDRPPADAIATTVRCSDDSLLALLAGEPGVVATVQGERGPLELVQGWFADATTA